MGLFDKRRNYKPFEYPEVMQFVEAINKSFWVHSEVDFTADIQDFHTNLSPSEKEVVKRGLLGIAQIEVGVKTFWGNLYNYLPKPEMNGLGSTFAECEFRHSEAYSRLIEVLGYNDEFEKLLEIPIFKERLDIIEDNLSSDNILERLLFFTVIIENTALFSQFADILSFTRFKGYMKNVSNIIAWTSVDEQIHANAGIYLINKIKEEAIKDSDNPEEVTSNIEEIMHLFVDKFIDFESRFLDWVFEEGELSFFSKEDLLNFMKYRIDEAFVALGVSKKYNITEEQYKPMKWFEEEVFAQAQDDFFAKRPVDYTKHDKSITANDLF